jgi:hypothetical protein
MPLQRKSRLGTAGLLTVVATAGALVAYGRRDGDPTKAFRQAGRMLLESPSVSDGLMPVVAVAAGVLHHAVIAAFWGMLLMLVVRAFRGWRFAAAALLFAAAFGALNLWLLPPILRVGYAVVTSVGRVIPLVLAVTVALLVTPWASGVPERQPAIARPE